MKCGDTNNPAGGYICRSGKPCGSDVAHGTYRCYMHGGSSPAAKIKAEQAMALIRVPAVESLYRVIQTMDTIVEQFGQGTCLQCGYPSGDVDQIQAVSKAAAVCAKTAAMVLDRTGLGPKSTLEVKQSDGDLDLGALTAQEKARMIFLLGEIRTLKQQIKERVSEIPGSLRPGAHGHAQPDANSTGTLIQ